MLQPSPDFLEVELRHHDDQHQETEDEEAVLVFLFHYLNWSLGLGSEKRALSPSSRFS